MATVYILESLQNRKRYVGSTDRDVEVRLKEHNAGVTAWTRQNGPFKLIHTENFESVDLARRREQFLKSGKGRRVVQNIVSGTFGPVAQSVRASGS